MQERVTNLNAHWRTDSGYPTPFRTRIQSRTPLMPANRDPQLANAEADARDSWKLLLGLQVPPIEGAIIGGWKCPGSGTETLRLAIEKVRPVRRGGQGIPNKSLQSIVKSTLWRTLAPCAGLGEVDFCRTSSKSCGCSGFPWGLWFLSTSPTLSLSTPSCFFSVSR